MSPTMSPILPTLAAGVVALTLSISPAAAHQPGEVKCYSPTTRTAHAVCASKRLSRLDARMNATFDDARAATYDRFQRRALYQTQRDWVAKRNRCGAFKFCIWLRTKERIRQLNRFVRQI